MLRAEIDAARVRAASERKRVAVVFGADWCGDSRALEAALADPLVAPVVDDGFVVVRADVGNRDRHLDVAGELGIAYARGLPAVAVLEPDGRIVHADSALARARSMSRAEIASCFARWRR